MSWSASGVFAYAMLQLAKKAGQTLNSDTYYAALYGNTGTPDRTVTTAVLTEYGGAASQWIAANENSGAGYSAGGASLTSVTLTQTTNVVTFTAANTVWTNATINAYGDLVYDFSSTNQGLCFNYFGGQQQVTAGTFTVAWSGSGVMSITT